MTADDPDVPLNIDVNPLLKKALKLCLAAEDKTLHEWLDGAIRDYLQPRYLKRWVVRRPTEFVIKDYYAGGKRTEDVVRKFWLKEVGL